MNKPSESAGQISEHAPTNLSLRAVLPLDCVVEKHREETILQDDRRSQTHATRTPVLNRIKDGWYLILVKTTDPCLTTCIASHRSTIKAKFTYILTKKTVIL